MGRYTTERPHYHAIIYSPYSFTKEDFTKILQKIWRYGNVRVRDIHIKGINYIAKHQVKADIGSKYQRKNAPIFYISSKYKGGIGYNLLHNKECIRNYELNIHIMQSGKFTSTIPRFIRSRLHPQKLTSDEWDDLEKSSYANYVKYLHSLHIEPWSFEIWKKNRDSTSRFYSQYLEINHNMYNLDAAKKKAYFINKFNDKLLKSKTDNNSNDYEYF